MTAMLDKTDVVLLAGLSNDPLASFDELGKVSNLSSSGALKRTKRLVESKFLGNEFARAQVDYAGVGLETVLILAQSPPSMWRLLEAACDAHPYTQFRIRVMGAINGFMLAFTIPVNSRTLLLEFLDSLKSKGIVTGFSTHLALSDSGHSETRFELFDPVSNNWTFDWKSWETHIEQAQSHSSLPQSSLLHQLDETDIKVLRMLSVDGRAERRIMADKLGIKSYELSRRLKFLYDHKLVRYYRLVHETGILGIEMTVVIRCRASLVYSGKILNSAHEFPFQGSVYPLEDGFLLLANMPPGEVTNLVTLLQSHCDSVELMWGDYDSSMKYFFDNDPSNFRGSSWSVDRGYMVEMPLKAAVESPMGTGVGT